MQLLWKKCWWFLQKLNIALPYETANSLLVISPPKLKTSIQTDTCTQMLIVILFTITTLCWVKEARHRRSHGIIRNIQNRQIQRDRRLLVVIGLGEEGMQSDCLIGMEFPFGIIKMFWNQIEVMVAQHHVCTVTKLYAFKWLTLWILGYEFCHNTKKSKGALWLIHLSIQLWISDQVMISELWDQALHQAPHGAWSILKILSLFLSRCPCPLCCLHSYTNTLSLPLL